MASSASPARISAAASMIAFRPGAADPVDRRGGRRVGEAGLQRGLAGRGLPGPSLEDLAHEDLVDRRSPDRGPPALDGRPDGDPTELDGRDGRQRPAELADRRSGGADEVDVAVRAGAGRVMARIYIARRGSTVTTREKVVRDDHPVDLVGALVDLRALRVAHEPLDAGLARVAGRPEQLDRVRRDPHRGVRGGPLRQSMRPRRCSRRDPWPRRPRG